MTSALLAVVLAAAPRIASPGFVVHDIPADKASLYTEHFGVQLALAGLRVVTQKDMAALVGLERQRELLGCADANSSCLAELASALGADGVVLGDIARIGKDRYQLTLKIIKAADGSALAIRSSRVTGEEALLDELTALASGLASEVLAQLSQPPPGTGVTASASGSRKLTLIPGAATVVLGVVAGVCFGLASGDSGRLGSEMFEAGQGAMVRDQGKALEVGGWVTASVAAVAAIGAVVVFLLTGSGGAPADNRVAVAW